MNLHDYLNLLPKESAEGWTTSELAAQWDISQLRARELVKQGIAAGIMVCCGNKTVPNMAGRTTNVPCYRQVQKPKKK